MIYAGLLAQAIGFLLIGPSPLLGWLHGGSASWLQVVGGLVLFGVGETGCAHRRAARRRAASPTPPPPRPGESMSMTPVMDDMMHSCGTAASSCINALSSLMASAAHASARGGERTEQPCPEVSRVRGVGLLARADGGPARGHRAGVAHGPSVGGHADGAAHLPAALPHGRGGPLAAARRQVARLHAAMGCSTGAPISQKYKLICA